MVCSCMNDVRESTRKEARNRPPSGRGGSNRWCADDSNGAGAPSDGCAACAPEDHRCAACAPRRRDVCAPSPTHSLPTQLRPPQPPARLGGRRASTAGLTAAADGPPRLQSSSRGVRARSTRSRRHIVTGRQGGAWAGERRRRVLSSPRAASGGASGSPRRLAFAGVAGAQVMPTLAPQARHAAGRRTAAAAQRARSTTATCKTLTPSSPLRAPRRQWWASVLALAGRHGMCNPSAAEAAPKPARGAS
jgi:hypothetical protein